MPAPSDLPCALCGQPAESRHHLVPKCKGGKVTEPLCQVCHRQLHALYDERTLARELNSIASLRSDPRVARYLAWRDKHPDATVKTKDRNKRWKR